MCVLFVCVCVSVGCGPDIRHRQVKCHPLACGNQRTGYGDLQEHTHGYLLPLGW